jgi:hypothetical protein
MQMVAENKQAKYLKVSRTAWGTWASLQCCIALISTAKEQFVYVKTNLIRTLPLLEDG